MIFRRVAVSLWGPGQSAVPPFACCARVTAFCRLLRPVLWVTEELGQRKESQYRLDEDVWLSSNIAPSHFQSKHLARPVLLCVKKSVRDCQVCPKEKMKTKRQPLTQYLLSSICYPLLPPAGQQTTTDSSGSSSSRSGGCSSSTASTFEYTPSNPVSDVGYMLLSL